MKELLNVFNAVVSMSLTATYVMLVVVVLRQILKKAANRTPYGIWLIVFLRLVLPASFTSAFSLLPLLTQWIVPATIDRPFLPGAVNMSDTWTGVNQPANSIPPSGQWLPAAVENPQAAATALPQTVWTPTELLAVIWVAGIAVALFYMLRSYMQMQRRLGEATLVCGNIYETDAVAAPFVFGLLKPRIILPVTLAPEFREPVLRHEQVHVNRRDYLIKPLAWLVLAIHWFNPFVWLAFHLMNLDLEMSCDARALRRADHEQKIAYGSALLHVSRQHGLLAMNPLAFGESGIKTRVKQILNDRKPAVWITLGAVTLTIVAGFMLLANPPTASSAEGTKTPSLTSATSATLTNATESSIAPTKVTSGSSKAGNQTDGTTATLNGSTTTRASTASAVAPALRSADIEIWSNGQIDRRETITENSRLRVIQNAVTAYFLDSSGSIAKKPEQMGNHIRLKLTAPGNGTNANQEIPLTGEPYYVFYSDGKYHIQYGLTGMDKRVHTAYDEPFVSLLLGSFGIKHESEHRLLPRTDGVDAFLKLAKDIGFAKLPKGYPDDDCYNITPPDIQKLGCEIFKYRLSAETYLRIGNEIHVLGAGFGGAGLTDVQICDFDRDRQSELIYTFSWGSGIHRSQIGVFNLKTRQETLLKGALMNGDMYLGKVADDQFTAYSAKVDIKDGNFADLVLTRIDPIAQIFARDSAATVVYFTNTYYPDRA